MALAFAGEPGGAAWRAAAAFSARTGEPLEPWLEAPHRPLALFVDAGHEAIRWAEQAGVPVIVVCDEAPFVAWSRGERPLNAVAVIDPDEASVASLRFVSWLAEAGAVRPGAIHSYGPFEARWHYGLPVSTPTAKVESLVERDLRAIMADAGAHEWPLALAGATERKSDHVAELLRASRPELVVIPGLELLQALLRGPSPAVASVPAAPAIAPPRPLRTILVATDLTPRAVPAIAEAAALVAHDGLVHLVHLHRPGETFELQRGDLETRLQFQVPKPAPGRVFRTSWSLEPADHIARGIAQCADRMGADLVCVATHGRRGLRGAITGSVVRDLIGLIDKSMLVVPVRGGS